MFWLLVLLTILAACATAYSLRVPILARALGQSEARIERQLGSRG